MTSPNEPIISVRAGNDSKRWLMRGDGVDVSLCTCRQSVYEAGNSTALLGPLAVTDTVEVDGETWFAAHLSPAQTAALNSTTAKRRLIWVMEIVGGVAVIPAYTREVHRALVIEPQRLPPA